MCALHCVLSMLGSSNNCRGAKRVDAACIFVAILTFFDIHRRRRAHPWITLHGPVAMRILGIMICFRLCVGSPVTSGGIVAIWEGTCARTFTGDSLPGSGRSVVGPRRLLTGLDAGSVSLATACRLVIISGQWRAGATSGCC